MFRIKNIAPYIVFFVITLILEHVYFRGLKAGEFIFSSDQLFWFSYQEAFNNSFFIRKMDHLGVFNSWQLAVQFWDTVYYLIMYKFNFSFITVEKVSFFVTLLFSFVVSFVGFRRIAVLAKQKEAILPLLAVTLWYCLNPYTLILWHGGVYNLGLALTYALAPLIVYFFHLSVFTETSFRNRVLCALLLFLSSFVFWLFAVIVFFLAWYSVLFIYIRKVKVLQFLKRLGKLLVIYIPLVSVVLFMLFHEYMNNVGDLNTDYGPTFKSQKGGMWYQFLMIFSWGIYNVWVPRTLFPFGQYFLSYWYMGVTTALYALILFGGYSSVRVFFKQGSEKLGRWRGILNNDKNAFFLIFLVLLFVAVFFAKGAQDPLGGIFQFLFDHVPFFSVFRSADHRFGFSVVLSVAILLVYSSERFNRYLFSGTLVVLMLLQSYPLFTGTAIRGEEIKGQYFDRIIHVPQAYQEVADVINERSDRTSYVLILPSIQYGRYQLDPDATEEYVGQDLFPKIIDKPFVYISTSTGMSRASEKTMEDFMSRKAYKELDRFPIGYLILRNDIPCPSCLNLEKEYADKEFLKIFQNSSFSVYELPDATPLVNASDAFFKMVNPTQFQVELKNVKDKETLNLGLSFHKGWKVYLNKKDESIVCDKNDVRIYSGIKECINQKKFFLGDEWRYLFDESLFDESHILSNGYANTWTVDADFVREHYGQEFYSRNDDGTIDLNLTIYYQPQSWLYVYGLVSVLSCMVCVWFLLRGTFRKIP